MLFRWDPWPVIQPFLLNPLSHCIQFCCCALVLHSASFVALQSRFGFFSEWMRRPRFQIHAITSGNTILAYIFSNWGFAAQIRFIILQCLYHHFPFGGSNPDIAAIIVVHPCWFLTCDSFRVVQTPSVADCPSSAEENSDWDF